MPALGLRALTPLYDLVVALLTGENTWRNALLGIVAPQPGERILSGMLQALNPGGVCTRV